jgi:hypothetical protein
LYQVADALKHIDMETLETINPFTVAPWEERIQPNKDQPQDFQTRAGLYTQIAVSSSARNELVGFGVAIEETTTSVSKTETEDSLRHNGCKSKAESVLCGASSDGTCIEHGRGAERLQDYSAHEQQSGGSDTKESSTTVRPEIRLPTVQVDGKATEKWKPNQYPVEPNERRQ